MILDIDPTVDYAFKYVFGRESTTPILVDLLDGVLDPPPEHRIRDLDLLNPFNPKEALDDKLSILDIKARDQSGRQFNVEMQMLGSRYYEKRILYYWAKLHQQQLHEGQNYLDLKPTISISFLNHVLFRQVTDFHLVFRLTEQTHAFPLTEEVEFHIIQLPRFTKTAAELTSRLDFWLYFLRHAAKIDTEAIPAVLQQPLLLRAVEELKVLTQTDIERERYEARRKGQLDHDTSLRAARLEGLEEGQAEARDSMIHMIHFCEQLLHRPESPAEQLARSSLDELRRLAADLESQVRQQR